MFESATKENIFDETIALISQYGFEGVSIRNIADHVGIKAPSIYNYYTNKDELLNDIYEYFLKYVYMTDSSDEVKKEIIRTGTVEEIVTMFTGVSFARFQPKIAKRMMIITKIIFMRKYFDERAAEIYLAHMEYGLKRNQALLDYGVAINRFKPFNTEAFANIFNSLYIDMGVRAFATKNYVPKEPEEEKKVLKWMCELIQMVLVK